MRKRSKTIIAAGGLAAIATIGGIGTATAANAASVDPTISYSGQGVSATGIPNNDPAPANDGGTGQFANWDGPGDAYDAGDGYLLWVLSANGAKTATINLPDGQHPMTKFGSNFKYASDFFTKGEQATVTASYTGTTKGTVVFTISHGHAADTNVPSGVTWDGNTGTGTVGKDAVGDITDPMFTAEKAFHTETWWLSSLGNKYHRDQDVRNVYAITATPILGDVTGDVVGWTLTPGNYIKMLSGAYSGAPYVGYIDDGGSFAGFEPHVQTWTPYENLKVNDTPLPTV